MKQKLEKEKQKKYRGREGIAATSEREGTGLQTSDPR